MHSIAIALAPLASEVAQAKYIANATPSEYLLPEELLEDAYDALRLVRECHPSAQALSAEARMQILALAPLLSAESNAHVVESSKSPELLLRHPTWVAIREQAAVCLRALGFDLKAWEAMQ
ncbi:hypothetical protein DZC73_28600 [Albitalea terrae]|uniref:Uncharacterized protein n=1 Tax=Piscinibacter terrae TaxID=2496871 RepID=A0A3N7HHF4_9BURK|nr:hypothetical protein [Albitalea terrae]RQP21438.1 hypothetical protein DZC73_28600 [Albitalea terrae]